MTWSGESPDFYRSIGVNSIISASGSTTAYGGSKLRPEVMDAMNRASNSMVNMDELNRAAGRVLADITGAEAGFVCSGAAGGLVLQAAAVVAGSDPAKMARLPNTDGMKNEIIIHKSHRFPYDQCYLSVGAKFVEIGDGRRCQPWQLEAAFTENTAAVAYLFSPFVTRRSIPFPQVCEIAHARGVPVIVDAASFIPPRSNLRAGSPPKAPTWWSTAAARPCAGRRAAAFSPDAPTSSRRPSPTAAHTSSSDAA